jgi:hypothetical protein
VGKIGWILVKKLYLHPLFLLGLAIRLALIFSTVPLAVSDWYVPFLDASTAHFTLDPWSVWLNGGGTPVAFPYGYAMWLAFLPLTIAAKLIGLPLLYGYEFTLLATDFSLLLVLRQLLPRRDRLLLAVYWLSPIVILASYGLGLNDLIPADSVVVLHPTVAVEICRRCVHRRDFGQVEHGVGIAVFFDLPVQQPRLTTAFTSVFDWITLRRCFASLTFSFFRQRFAYVV